MMCDFLLRFYIKSFIQRIVKVFFQPERHTNLRKHFIKSTIITVLNVMTCVMNYNRNLDNVCKMHAQTYLQCMLKKTVLRARRQFD